MQKLLAAIDTGLAAIEKSMIIGIVTTMVVLSFLQIILRLFFDEGIVWGDIFLRHLVLWVGFMGASLATRDEKHINMDILTRLTPGKFLPAARLVTNTATLMVCLVLTHASYGFIQNEIEFNTLIFQDVPAWPFQIIIPIGFALIGFRFLIKILQQLSGVEASPESGTGTV